MITKRHRFSEIPINYWKRFSPLKYKINNNDKTNMFKELKKKKPVYIIKEYIRIKSHKIHKINKEKIFLKEAHRNF